ncbi:MAG: type VI secretion system Vgr family protein, partial [Candidatus Latescibacterota bacterium]
MPASNKEFAVFSTALGPDVFSVVSFTGREWLSRLYEFDISLVSERADIDLDKVIAKPAHLAIRREEGDPVFFHGIIRKFEQQGMSGNYMCYRATLSPRLWWLTLTHHNQVCLNQSVQTFVEKTLLNGGLTAADYEFRLAGNYPDIPYVCQYGESHFNFISRWLEREGMYYYFEQGTGGEKLIITDAKSFHSALPQGRDLIYSPPSGLDSSRREEVIQSLSCCQRFLPEKVVLRDYNYERPSLEVLGEAMVDPSGRGEVYLYGEHFSTPEEGNRLAAIRAEELFCRKQEFVGESTVPFLRPG